jgi:hypothetical protein
MPLNRVLSTLGGVAKALPSGRQSSRSCRIPWMTPDLLGREDALHGFPMKASAIFSAQPR